MTKEKAAENSFSLNHKTVNWQVTSGVALGVSLVAAAAFFFHPFVSESSYATNTNVVASYSGEDWTISAPTSTAADAGGLTFDIEGNPTGVNMAKKDTVTSGSTNVPDYQIYVSVNTEGGAIPNTSNSDYSIAATSGTVTDATTNVSGAATLSANSWGYALSSFNTNINYNDLVSSSSSSSWSSSKWSKLPYVATSNLTDDSTVTGTAAKIYDSTTNSGDSVDVYYAVNADNNLASGEYQTTVTYTLIGEIPASPIADGMNMQDVTTDMCKATPLYSESGTTYTLKDTRDNNTYKVRKLADGNCWMVQNLRLTHDTLSAAGNTTGSLTSSNTNVSSDKTLPAVNSSFCTNNNATCYNTLNHMDSGNAEYGAYYSWSAATLDNTVGSKSSGNVETSICPKSGSGSSYVDSWHLPTGNTNGEWYNMMTKYTDGVSNFTGASANTRRNFTDETITGTKNNNGNYVPNFPFSGYRDGSSTVRQGSYGDFWSSTAYNADYAYYAYVGSDGYVDAGTYNHFKRYGYSVRCVLTGVGD